MGELILSVHTGIHDAAAAISEDYELRAAVALERLTRHKNDGGSYPDRCIDEVLGIVGASRADVDVLAVSRCELPTAFYKTIRGTRRFRELYRRHVEGNVRRYLLAEFRRYRTAIVEDVFDVARFRKESGFRDDTVVFFYNHHEAHALPALFYTSWNDALLVTADAGGDSVNYSHRHFADQALNTIYGGEDCILLPEPIDSLGRAYAYATEALGFTPFRHEGKLTGLSAFGEPLRYDAIASHFSVDARGRIVSDFCTLKEMREFIAALLRDVRREDAAASIQKALEETVLASIKRLLECYPSRHLGVAGGVFANVRLNRRLAEELPLDEIFIFPPMGDDGLPAGGSLCYLLHRDGLAHWLAQRRPLHHLYLGRDYTKAIDAALAKAPGVRRSVDAPLEGTVRRLQSGAIAAIYVGRMEFGPRALGARSIIASPSDPRINESLNTRLSRSDFMPFAPYVLDEDAARVFEITSVNRYAARFMTITCAVRPEWRERIPAIVHVDGTARPQIVRDQDNPLFASILRRFRDATGLPVLINTSFNVHEEPIVNTPEECRQALRDGRIDFVVTTQGIYEQIAS